ncbi:MAG: hypothetical protein HY265_08195 [Deltaproteobacteria bacterium]|nr:hypothetical protein [Deltaproteobacteria bacterium]
MDSLKVYKNNKGIALIVALLMSVAIMAMAAGVLYFITQSTTMSGAGKKYATAAGAADGAVEVMKNNIYLIFHDTAAPAVFNDTGTLLAGASYPTAVDCLKAAIKDDVTAGPGRLCQTSINLPGISGSYSAAVTVQKLYTATPPGSSIEFAKRPGGAPSSATFYRITTSVTTADNPPADNAALHRVME